MLSAYSPSVRYRHAPPTILAVPPESLTTSNMPQTHEISLRRAPRYTKQPIKILAAFIIFLLMNCLLLVRDIQRHSSDTIARDDAFKTIMQPSGEGTVHLLYLQRQTFQLTITSDGVHL